MTRDEALEQLRLGPGINEDVSEEYNDAVNIAIKALEHPERNVVAVVPCGDTISRQAVIDYICRILNQGTGKKKSFEFIQKYVEKLPPVTPERSKGKWLTPYGSYRYRLTIYRCSLCEYETENNSNYCPKCGAYMREVGE